MWLHIAVVPFGHGEPTEQTDLPGHTCITRDGVDDSRIVETGR
jgi:hypothetical protein